MLNFQKFQTFYTFLIMELCDGGELSTCLEEYQKRYNQQNERMPTGI